MVSLAIAQQIRELCGSAIGISTTGIAGPTGGSKEKPIGLYYISLKSHEGFSSCRKFLFKKQSRQIIRRQAAQAALRVLLEFID
jgi:nicotinamide mononucleotide (NMN) deamidase PncC